MINKGVYPYSKFNIIALNGHPILKEGSKSFDDYIEEQEYYILNGITIGGEYITGSLYHWLNYYNIDFINPETKRREKIYPYFCDVDKEVLDTLEECRNDGDDLVIVKVRDKGLSNILVSECLRHNQWITNSRVGAVFPGGQSNAQTTFKEKYFEALSNYPKWARVNYSIDNKNTIENGFTLIDNETKIETYGGINTRMSFFDAVSKDVLKSDRYDFAIIDEVGEIDIAQALIDTSVANFRQGDLKIGTLMITGTTNKMNKGYDAFRDLYFNAKDANSGFRSLFIGGTRKYFPYVNTVTGESLLKEAKEKLDIKREVAKKAGTSAYAEFLQNYGETIEEVFTNPDMQLLNKENMTKQIVALLAGQEYKGVIQKGNLREVPLTGGGTGIIFELDNLSGRWEIYKQPIHLSSPDSKKKDFCGVDSVYKDQAPQSESKNAIVLYRPFIDINTVGQCPVCIYHHRYSELGGREMFYEDLRLTLEYFKCKALIERVDDDIFTWFRKKNLLHLLKERPAKVTQHLYRSVRWEDYGVPPHGEEFRVSVKLLKNEVDLRCQNIMFVTLLQNLMNFKPGERSNSDLGDAFKWALLYADAATKFDAETEIAVKSKPTSSLPRFTNSGTYVQK